MIEVADENLTRHIVRASFSEERTPYLYSEAKVVYTAKDGKDKKKARNRNGRLRGSPDPRKRTLWLLSSKGFRMN